MFKKFGLRILNVFWNCNYVYVASHPQHIITECFGSALVLVYTDHGLQPSAVHSNFNYRSTEYEIHFIRSGGESYLK